MGALRTIRDSIVDGVQWPFGCEIRAGENPLCEFQQIQYLEVVRQLLNIDESGKVWITSVSCIKGLGIQIFEDEGEGVD